MGRGLDRTLIFVGHSLQDQDLRAVILEAGDAEMRPRHYVISPSVDAVQERFWGAKRITALAGTFDDFVTAITAKGVSPFQGLAASTEVPSIPISAKFVKKNAKPSRDCLALLEAVTYVNAVTKTEPVSPKDFYRGYNPGWSAIEQKLDVPRYLTDTILAGHVLRGEADDPGLEVILIKAHAGAGKSVMLRRLAWDSAHDYDRLCLYVPPNAAINAGGIQEIIELCKERVFLFVDDAADRVRELQNIIGGLGPEKKHLTIIMAERINEWNVSGIQCSHLLTDEYELEYLSQKEIDGLLALLEQHRALGTLERATLEERKAALKERAGRQLLVALHEATLGKPFADIIQDEYSKITPETAQQIYLTICVLHRLAVPVRAGIISRMHGIAFEEFTKRFFHPLEHIVHTKYDEVLRDFTYEARHPHIAEIVFERILSNPEHRFEKYILCLKQLNIDFGPDRKAFRMMIRARSLIEMFPNHEMIAAIYSTALDSEQAR